MPYAVPDDLRSDRAGLLAATVRDLRGPAAPDYMVRGDPELVLIVPLIRASAVDVGVAEGEPEHVAAVAGGVTGGEDVARG